MCYTHSKNRCVLHFSKRASGIYFKDSGETEVKISKLFGYDLFIDVTQQGFVSFRIFVSSYFCNFFLHCAEWKFQKIPEAFFMHTDPSDHLCSPSLLLLGKYIGEEDLVGTRTGNNSYRHLLIVFFYLTG